MKTFLSLLAASALGLGTCLPATTQAAIPGEEVLIAQRGWDDEEEENEYREPVDKSTIKDRSGKDTWIPIGFDDRRIAIFWTRVSTYTPLNENSFRVQVQYKTNNGIVIEGRMDVNCKNKDYYIRPNGVFAQNAPWAVIPKGSGYESLAVYFCKRTAAKAEWGFTPETSAIWDAPIPTISADSAEGEWIKHYDKPDGESYYNDAVTLENGIVTFAMYYRSTKGDMSTTNQDQTFYGWLRGSCKRNISSVYRQLDPSVPGIWLPPTPGAPGGATMIVRKKFCK